MKLNIKAFAITIEFVLGHVPVPVYLVGHLA